MECKARREAVYKSCAHTETTRDDIKFVVESTEKYSEMYADNINNKKSKDWHDIS